MTVTCVGALVSNHCTASLGDATASVVSAAIPAVLVCPKLCRVQFERKSQLVVFKTSYSQTKTISKCGKNVIVSINTH
jgi:hypothetical protein